MKILLVDDDENLRGIVAMRLRYAGFEDVESVSNGRQALDVLELLPSVRAVVTDRDMPEVDGCKLCAEVKKTYGLPVVMMSGRPRDEQIDAVNPDLFIDKEKGFTNKIIDFLNGLQ